MPPLTAAVLRLSQTWWSVGLVAAANFLCFGVLFWLEDRFSAISGLPVFDTQNDLTLAAVSQQLPAYTGQGRAAYWAFAAFDFVFPLVAALFVAVIWGLLLRLNASPLAGSLLALGLPLLPFATTLFDYLENFGFIGLVLSGQPPNLLFAEAALVFKKLKLLGLFALGPVTLGLALLLLGDWLTRVSSKRA